MTTEPVVCPDCAYEFQGPELVRMGYVPAQDDGALNDHEKLAYYIERAGEIRKKNGWHEAGVEIARGQVLYSRTTYARYKDWVAIADGLGRAAVYAVSADQLVDNTSELARHKPLTEREAVALVSDMTQLSKDVRYD